MRLHKALKLRKKLIGEITDLKKEIQSKNSFMVGSLNPEKYNVLELYNNLLSKIDELVGLKFAINEGNREIQSKIFVMAEYKGLIDLFKHLDTKEGEHPVSGRFGDSSIIKTFIAQIDDEGRNNIIKTYQEKVDALQEEIDTHNYITDIPWGKYEEEIEIEHNID